MNYDDFVAVSIEPPIGHFPKRLYIDDVWAGNPYYPVRMTIFDGASLANGIEFSAWGFNDNTLNIAEGEGATDSTSAIVWESSNGEGWQGLVFTFPPQDFQYSWETDTLNLHVKAPAGINALSLGFYDQDGNAVWYAVDSGKFGFDDEWKHLSIALQDFELYWDSFDYSKVTQFRLENGFENQTIPERVLFDQIYTSNSGGGMTTVKTSEEPNALTFQLKENYPNPFNPSTTITFVLGKTTEATLSIFNLRGEKVTDLVSGQLATGLHTVPWDAGNQPSGIYFYKLTAGDLFTEMKKMMLVR